MKILGPDASQRDRLLNTILGVSDSEEQIHADWRAWTKRHEEQEDYEREMLRASGAGYTTPQQERDDEQAREDRWR